MHSLSSYMEYLGLTFVALTHKKISFILIGVLNQTYLNVSQSYLQIAVLILTGIGATLRICLDIRNNKGPKNNKK